MSQPLRRFGTINNVATCRFQLSGQFVMVRLKNSQHALTGGPQIGSGCHRNRCAVRKSVRELVATEPTSDTGGKEDADNTLHCSLASCGAAARVDGQPLRK